MWRISAGSVTNPLIRAKPPHRGHTSTSTGTTIRSRSANRHRRARNASQSPAGSSEARQSLAIGTARRGPAGRVPTWGGASGAA